MKLILLIVLLTYLPDTKAQKFRQEQFPFPPQFQSPNSGFFSSDSSLYLPPESHTSIPYFPINKMNGLQFPLLPPTGTKVPAIYPPHFPLMVSTTLVPNLEDDDEVEDHGRIKFSPTPQPHKYNQTDKNPQQEKEKREMRPVPKMLYPQPIQNRNDIKFPFKPQATPPTPGTSSAPNQQQQANPTPATRRMIISSESQNTDFRIDQSKAASFQGPQFLPAGGGIFVSSTTEPAIPILRLSNEMDLDGSFSYEALGADQTHYVQHSRMENMGPDKVEQVVEGSYSYVGDNGQTYTVHYIADANGFRASGDHLPVAPPVPEIIQRAVQYNLAEESKKPPHLRDNGNWIDNSRDSEIGDNNKNQQFSLPPPKNLFTGRTPEAFSYSYSQGSNTGNNLVAAASNQSPIKAVEYTTEQSKPKINNGPISPQITFLASQGAHVPSMNPVQDTISRMFTSQKSPMPQLVNYEASFKEAEQDPNKGLWRWQYGYNANNLNQNSNKETISRSSGEGDDIMINFSDMTPEQYTKMIHSQLEYSPENDASDTYTQSIQASESQQNQLSSFYQKENNNDQKEYQKLNQNQEIKEEKQNIIADYHKMDERQTLQNPNYIKNQGMEQPYLQKYDNINHSTRIENTQQLLSTLTPFPQTEERFKETQNIYEGQSTVEPFVESRKLVSDRPKILTHKDFVFPPQTITQSYNFDENTFYEPRKIKTLHSESTMKPVSDNVNDMHNLFQKVNDVTDRTWSESEIQESTTPQSYISSVSNLKFSDFIFQESQNDFKPVVTTTTTTTTEISRPPETTTESIVENILENNIFLKNLFNPEKTETTNPQNPEPKNDNKIDNEPKKVLHVKIEAEPKTDKVANFVPYHPKPSNEMKVFQKKPMDLAEIMNFISMKNHFESSKMKSSSKNKPTHEHNNKSEVRFIPVHQERDENENIHEQKTSFKPSLQHHEELRGIIKNYKVLQRNHNINKYDNSELKRELSPPPLKSPNLPPLGRAGPSMKSYLPPIFVL